MVKSITRLVKENFDRLFDFPVTVPEIKTVEIKGTFKIITSDNASIGLSDFNFYDLTVEYSTRVDKNESQPVSVNFNWSNVSATELNNNTLPFSFAPLIINGLDSPIQVRVKGYDGSLLWEEEFVATNPDLQKLRIEVPLSKPLVVTSSGGSQSVSGNKKLQGKLVEMTGKCELKGATILVQTKKTNDSTWKVVGVATTDGSGNFSMPYPYGIYSAAQALVSLTPNSPADITILTDTQHASLNETIADDFLYLLLEDVVCEAKANEDDCDCHEPQKSNRLPDQYQLINSDEYSQDIGGSCINLSTPNRTLNEYSHKAVVRTSDPEVANYTLVKYENGVFRLKGGNREIKRRKVNLNNVIRWQDAPDNKDNLSFYQAVTVATGHILHYKVAMKADGYSMGELLYSLPLAPGQKKQIVMFDQTHTLRGSETQRLAQRENLAAALVNDIDIADTLGGSINENTRGSSSANTSGISGGLGLAGIIQGIAATLGVAGGIANANSSASQSSSRQVAQHFQEQMRNGITQNAQSYREQNASVITTVQEGQEYGVTAEVVANHNHCHSLTMMYFEVLRHYAIYQELSQVEECLFVPLLMTEFSKNNIYKWRDVLASHLLPMPSETYLQPFTVVKSGRQHPLLRAFDAIERRKTAYENVDFPEGAYDDEIINFITGEMYIQTNLPRPKTVYDRIKSWPIIEKEEGSNWSWKGAIAGAILGGPLKALAVGFLAADGVTITMDAQKIINEYITIDANFRSLPPSKAIRVIKFDGYFFEEGGNDKKQWLAYSDLLGKPLMDMLEYYFKDRLISEWDNIFYNDIAPVLFERIVEKIKIGTFSALDFSSERKYKGGNALMRINLRGNGSNKKRNEIESIRVELNTISNVNIGLFGLIIPNFYRLTNDLITLNVNRLTIRYSTSHYNGILYSGGLGNDDLIDGTEIFTPENANEKRNPRKEDKYLALKLIEHLNSNLEHYNKVLWRNLDPDRRYMLLDGFRIETYDDFGQTAGFRSLASVIKNELIGISGNSLIMPVAPGYKIDRSYIVEQPIEGPAEEINLFELYKPLTPAPPYRISVPSKGVFAEAVQGACDACEKVKDNTSQDWDKFKTDEPTVINPVTTPVPVVTDWKAAFKDFATPIVNIQNAPAAPVPGAGLAGLSELLGKNDVFRDVTGLDANQKNAMQTYLSNQQNAKEFAQMAKDIYTMDNNTKNSDAIADSIRNSPELSNEEKADLLKKHFNQKIDGGQSDKAAKEAEQNNKPTLTDAAVKAIDQNKPVKATNTDATGRTEAVEVGTSSSAQKFRVTGTTYWVPQGTKTNACWAAAATMMKSWKDHRKYSIENVLALTPPEYLEKYTNNQLLLVAEKDDFIAAISMVSEPPASYTFDHYIDWLKQYGPLWITVDSNTSTDQISPHAIILIGYNGDGTEQNSELVFLDPAKSGEQTEVFAEFDGKYGQMASDNPGALMTQIVHFKDAILGEGSTQTQTKWSRKLAIPQTRKSGIAKDALTMLSYFKTSSLTLKWQLTNKIAFYDRLEELILNPALVDQAQFGFCGEAVFFRIWIEVDPLSFVYFACKMVENGIAKIGKKIFQPHTSLLNTSYTKVINSTPGLISEAEWVIMSSIFSNLRTDSNGKLSKELGTVVEDVIGYLKATELFEVSNFGLDLGPINTILSFLDMDFDELTLDVINSILRVHGNSMEFIFAIDSALLEKQGLDFWDGTNHWVLLTSTINPTSVDDSFSFSYWCWGAERLNGLINNNEIGAKSNDYISALRKNSFWYEIAGDGKGSEITVGGDGSIYVLGSDTVDGGHQIFKYENYTWNLLHLDIKALKIAGLPGKELLIIDTNGEMSIFDGGGWTSLPNQLPADSTSGKAIEIAASSNGTIYALGDADVTDGHPIFRLDGDTWTKIEGGAIKISVDKYGNPWIINLASSKNVLEWNPVKDGENKWEVHNTKANEIAVINEDNVLIIGDSKKIGKLLVKKSDKFSPIEGLAKKVCVGKEGIPFIVGTDDRIYMRKPIPPKTSL